MAFRLVAAAPLLALATAAAAQQPVSAGGVPPRAERLENPMRDDRQAGQDGEKLFTAFNCDGCHSLGAVGGVGPSLADGRWRYGGADAVVFQSIYYGRPRGMPAFGGILPPDAIWRLVAYLRSLEPAQDVSTTTWTRK
jgi:cytochrome c oxidase cbb3-type subunit III